MEDGTTVRIAAAIGSADFVEAGSLIKLAIYSGLASGAIAAGFIIPMAYIKPLFSFFVPFAMGAKVPVSDDCMLPTACRPGTAHVVRCTAWGARRACTSAAATAGRQRPTCSPMHGRTGYCLRSRYRLPSLPSARWVRVWPRAYGRAVPHMRHAHGSRPRGAPCFRWPCRAAFFLGSQSFKAWVVAGIISAGLGVILTYLFVVHMALGTTGVGLVGLVSAPLFVVRAPRTTVTARCAMAHRCPRCVPVTRR